MSGHGNMGEKKSSRDEPGKENAVKDLPVRRAGPDAAAATRGRNCGMNHQVLPDLCGRHCPTAAEVRPLRSRVNRKPVKQSRYAKTR